jgi:hypothetical protein
MPFPLMRILIRRFTREICIQFHIGYFTVEIYDKKRGDSQRKYKLNELISYSIQFPNDRFSSIKFWLINNKTIEYSFFQKKQSEKEVDTTYLFDAFHKLINDYNVSADDPNKISLRPSFYASSLGLFCIIGLSVAFLIAILLYSLDNVKSLPITFVFSLMLILQIIAKRKKELDYFRKIR